MSIQEGEPQSNPQGLKDILAWKLSESAELIATRVYEPFERFMLAPLSLAQSYRERHPKIATAITVGVIVPPVLIGAGYGWASHELLSGLSAGTDAWIAECAVIKLISHSRPAGVSLLV